MSLYCSGGEEYLCTRWRRAWRGKGDSVQSRLFAIIGIFTVYEMADLYNIIITHIYTETRPVRPDIVVIIIISYVYSACTKSHVISSGVYIGFIPLLHIIVCVRAHRFWREKRKQYPAPVLHGPTIGTRSYRFVCSGYWYVSAICIEKIKSPHTHTHNTYGVLAWGEDDGGLRDRIIVMYMAKFGGRPSRRGFHAWRWNTTRVVRPPLVAMSSARVHVTGTAEDRELSFCDRVELSYGGGGIERGFEIRSFGV